MQRYHSLLKLKRVQILGFKSFCDRTDVQLSGHGIAAIVGPNGCGKSNISDAITWVLGEQSAKSLRGVKMEDVIFAGTRDRKPTGMAEVSLTLVDPDVYDASDSGEAVNIASASNRPAEPNDWDEAAERNMGAEATAAAVAAAQPGPIPVGEESEEIEVDAPIDPEAQANAELDAEAGTVAPNPVVLKIRRRKFNRAPVRAGEITVTRRLFRSGESEYLLNGKICRLRDIQDIFFGTGLSGETTPSSARSASASSSPPNPSTAAPSSKRPPASPASKPKSASPNSALKPPSKTSPASTTSSMKSPSRWPRSSASPPRPSATARCATNSAPSSASSSAAASPSTTKIARRRKRL